MVWLLRRGECSLDELAQHLSLPAESVRDLLEALASRDLVSDSGESADRRYRARLGATRSEVRRTPRA